MWLTPILAMSLATTLPAHLATISAPHLSPQLATQSTTPLPHPRHKKHTQPHGERDPQRSCQTIARVPKSGEHNDLAYWMRRVVTRSLLPPSNALASG